jgi:hypothetical protein
VTDSAIKYRALLIACIAIYGPMGPAMAAWYLCCKMNNAPRRFLALPDGLQGEPVRQ